IKPEKDSTLAMLLAAQRRGWRIAYFTQNGLSVRYGGPFGRGRLLTVEDDMKRWFTYGDEWAGRLEGLDVLLMRKDPPFDMEYVYTTYILQLAEERGVLVVNKPASLREINEKAYTAWFPHCTPPTLITRSHTDLLEFLDEQGKIVLKPLDGMGGRSIFVVPKGDPNTNVIFETLTQNGTRLTLAQRFLPETDDGDNRVMGARGEGRPLTPRDRWLASEIGPTLAAKGILFAGLDVIGEFVTEINVTSPTGIRELDRQFGIDIAARLLDAVERRLEK